jgi:hypothetical protein
MIIVSGQYPSSYFYIKHNILETGFCLSSGGPVDRASLSLQTSAPVQDWIYETSTAQTIYESYNKH